MGTWPLTPRGRTREGPGWRTSGTAGEGKSVDVTTNERQGEQLIGVRAHEDVTFVFKGLAARTTAPEFSSGAAAAYEWAMGHAERSPVTGAGADGIPGLRLLTAEVDAAVVQLDDPTLRAGKRDYVRGVHDALAWVCGYSDHAA